MVQRVCLAFCLLAVLSASVVARNVKNRAHLVKHRRLEETRGQPMTANPMLQLTSTNLFCDGLGVTEPGFTDYLDPLHAKCGCLCMGNQCFTCPPSATRTENKDGSITCKECPLPGKTPSQCATDGTSSDVKVPLDFDPTLFDDCHIEEADNKITCSKTCTDVQPCPVGDGSQPCGQMTTDPKLISLGIEKETLFARVQSVRTIDIRCEDSSMRLVKEGTKYFCKKTIANKGDKVPLVVVERVCRAGSLAGSDACYASADCPNPNLPPITGDLMCAPIKKNNLKKMFGELVKEYNKGLPQVTPARLEKLKTCLFHCHTAFAKYDECMELADLVSVSGETPTWSAAAAVLNSPLDTPEKQMEASLVVSHISSCYADPTLTNPVNMGNIGDDGKFVVPVNKLRLLESKSMSRAMTYDQYTLLHVPMGMSRKVKSDLTEMLLSEDPALALAAARVDSFATLAQGAYAQHHEAVAATNCRKWADMSFLRTKMEKGSATIANCVARCREGN